jgi:hypothetical protein
VLALKTQVAEATDGFTHGRVKLLRELSCADTCGDAPCLLRRNPSQKSNPQILWIAGG